MSNDCRRVWSILDFDPISFFLYTHALSVTKRITSVTNNMDSCERKALARCIRNHDVRISPLKETGHLEGGIK